MASTELAPNALVERLAGLAGMGRGRRRLVLLLPQLGDFASLEHRAGKAVTDAVVASDQIATHDFCYLSNSDIRPEKCATSMDEVLTLVQKLGGK